MTTVICYEIRKIWLNNQIKSNRKGAYHISIDYPSQPL
ncbi:Uncharacterized protein BM_BM14497 [Brugia malayi]|uniref:Bm14497 n=1 Tax=Brugia malayi TaxID=6279 RepID=A0A0J9Y5Z5_BRUMA|nr:Uncharacterized protein BM_BM14497 [Brugia malayi]CDQ03069.1 Bm14497 [Brugia malayi]VIO92463.1 Uncharacterized protein BM_BM14497 [Brugia malayi]